MNYNNFTGAELIGRVEKLGSTAKDNYPDPPHQVITL